MKITILTEAGKGIGFGHLTRSIALYQAMEEIGNNPELIVNGDKSILDFIKNKKHQILNWSKDERKTNELAEDSDFVIIDSYLANKQLYDNISGITQGKVLMVDDYKRLNYPKGFVVNPSISGESLDYPEVSGVKYLVGKDYIILRKEFWEIPEKEINKEISKVLVTFGGSNTSVVLNFVTRELKKTFDFEVITVDSISNRLEPKDMVDLMLECDICISGGGQTLYELARIGVPSIGICFAENQKFNLKGWQEKEFIEYIGWHYDKDLISNIFKSIDTISSYEERLKRSKVGRILVDSKGIGRIIKAVFN